MRFRNFFLASTLGTAGWTAILAGAGYKLGENFRDIDKIIGPASNAILIVIAVGYVHRLWTHRNIDPATGTARTDWARVSVIADSAGLADGLSTGLSLAPAPAIRAALDRLPGVEVRALDAAGRELRFT